MIDFLLKAVDRDSMEALAKEHDFMDADGNPVPGADFDAGIPVAPPEAMQGELIPGFHFNLRVSGEMEVEQTAGIPQTEKGELLPLRERTRLGLFMDANGTEWVGPNGVTTGITHAGVTFIDPESVATPQRVWQ